MIKRILTYDNEEDKETLSLISQKIIDINCEETKQCIQNLKDTLHTEPAGKGLSAIQIGFPLRICICSWADKEIIMINPIITHSRGQQEFLEGCLSMPNKYKKVLRSQKVWCTYTDENGNQQEIAEGGRMSNIIQHELDHFEGKCKLYDE